MAGWIEQEINMLVTSDPNQGAINRSADGSTFTVQLDEALAIPKEARNVSATVMQSTVWWVVPNIIQGENDMFYISTQHRGRLDKLHLPHHTRTLRPDCSQHSSATRAPEPRCQNQPRPSHIFFSRQCHSEGANDFQLSQHECGLFTATDSTRHTWL